MTLALEAAKRARDRGSNVQIARRALLEARTAFEAGNYGVATERADYVLGLFESGPAHPAMPANASSYLDQASDRIDTGSQSSGPQRSRGEGRAHAGPEGAQGRGLSCGRSVRQPSGPALCLREPRSTVTTPRGKLPFKKAREFDAFWHRATSARQTEIRCSDLPE